ncbi:MAG: hypothetical protein A2X59_12370 [Nitrospirae bacterium GWC2_42_7]|nr:MAG: hypothetical protein A2X59_12370 [Nitrospirae bacterium GWC2_42_7]
MNKEKSHYLLNIPGQIIFVVFFIIFTQTVFGFYAVYDQEPPGGFILLTYFALFWLVGDWFMKDSKKLKINWAFDMGFFLYLTWPLFIPFYLFKTRGFKRAITVIVGFIVLYLGIFYMSYKLFYYILSH